MQCRTDCRSYCSTNVWTESSTLLMCGGGHDAPCCRSKVEAGMLNWYIPLISSFMTGNQKGKKNDIFFSHHFCFKQT